MFIVAVIDISLNIISVLLNGRNLLQILPQRGPKNANLYTLELEKICLLVLVTLVQQPP